MLDFLWAGNVWSPCLTKSWCPCLVLSEKLEEQDHWSLCPTHVQHEEASGPSLILASQGIYEGGGLAGKSI